MRYHIYKRNNLNGNGSNYWYYWYLDETGKRISKACKNPDGSPKCVLKRNAQSYIALLENQDKDAGGTKQESPAPITFADFTSSMFLPGAEHLDRWVQHGKVLKDVTRRGHRDNLERFLIPWFGSLSFDKITPETVDNELVRLRKIGKDGVSMPCSSSIKNNILYTLNLVFKEAKRERLIQFVPDFEVFRRPKTGQDILTDDELVRLFPESSIELDKVWGGSIADYPGVGIMIGSLCCLAVSAGLRSGEVRGMQIDQLYPEYSGIVVDVAIDKDNSLTFLKKGSATDPRHRVVIIPEKTWRILRLWLDIRGDAPGFLFTYKNKYLSQKFLQTRFERGLTNAGIDLRGRKTTFHGLRYTYNTKMRRLLDAETLRGFVGHRSEQMTDQYDRPVLEQALAGYQEKLPAVNGFWG